jgi:hypothetical protein
VLIAAFQVKIRRPGQVIAVFQDGGVADTGIEPDIQNVGLLLTKDEIRTGYR